MDSNRKYITVKDLMTILETNHYFTAWRRHKAIRDSLGLKRKTLTMKEFCEFEGFDPEDVARMLE